MQFAFDNIKIFLHLSAVHTAKDKMALDVRIYRWSWYAKNKITRSSLYIFMFWCNPVKRWEIILFPPCFRMMKLTKNPSAFIILCRRCFSLLFVIGISRFKFPEELQKTSQLWVVISLQNKIVFYGGKVFRTVPFCYWQFVHDRFWLFTPLLWSQINS